MKKVPGRYICQFLLSIGALFGLTFAVYYTDMAITGSVPVEEMTVRSLTPAAYITAALAVLYIIAILRMKNSLPPLVFFDEADESLASQGKRGLPLLGKEAWIKTPVKLFLILFLENARLYADGGDILHIIGVCAKVSGYAMAIMVFLYFIVGLGFRPRKALAESWTRSEEI